MQALDLAGQPVTDLGIPAAYEQCFRPGTLEKSQQFGLGQPVIERHIDDAEFHAGEQDFDVGGRVDGHDRHAITLADVMTAERAGEPVHPRVGALERLPGSIREDEAWPAGITLGAEPQVVPDSCHWPTHGRTFLGADRTRASRLSCGTALDAHVNTCIAAPQRTCQRAGRGALAGLARCVDTSSGACLISTLTSNSLNKGCRCPTRP